MKFTLFIVKFGLWQCMSNTTSVKWTLREFPLTAIILS